MLGCTFVCINLCVDIYFRFSWVDTCEWKCWDIWYIQYMFKFIRNCQNVLQSGCTIFHSYEQYLSIPVALHPHQWLEWSAFFIIPILVGVKVASHCRFNLCISLMTDDVENLFMYMLAICISSFVKCLFNFLPIFIKLFSYCWLVIAFDIFWKKNLSAIWI